MPAQSILIYSAFHGVIGYSIQPLFGLVCADVNEGTTTVGVANHLIVHWQSWKMWTSSGYCRDQGGFW